MSAEITLNLAAFMKNSRVVGPGIRDAVWVQGCSICCPGCTNQAYLPHVTRRILPVRRLLEHFRHRQGAIDGISVLGGEPTEQAESVAFLLEEVQKLGFSTVVYTGRWYEDLLKDPDPRIQRLLAVTDLLIDGPFVMKEQDLTLHWRGSRNQRLLYLTPRLKGRTPEQEVANGEVVIDRDYIILNGIGTRPLAQTRRRQHSGRSQQSE